MGLRLCVDCCGVEAPAVAAPLTEGWLEGEGRGAAAPAWLLMGACRFVERLRISLPWTTMLSLDFFKSRVSISENTSASRSCERDTEKGTIAPRIEVNHRAYADVYDAEEPLVLLLELLLVKDLNGEDALLVHAPAACISVCVRAGVG